MFLQRIAIVSALLLALPALTWADGNAEEGRRKAETCLGCHGIKNYTNAYPSYPVPKICGQNRQYLLDALTAYAGGSRPHDTMHAQAATLNDADREDIAAYFADPSVCAKGD
jgi:cytochrome c553